MKPAFRRPFLFLVLLFCGSAVIVFIELSAPGVDVRFHDVVSTVVSEASDSTSQSDYAAFVKIDAESIATLGVAAGSPVRAYLPAFLDMLLQAGVSAVVFDFYFVDEEPELDPVFIEALSRFPVSISGTHTGSLEDLNQQLVREFSAIGDLRFAAGKIKRYLDVPAGTPTDNSIVPRLSLVAAELYTESRGISTADTLIPWLADTEEDSVRFRIPFRKPTSFFPSFSLIEILQSNGRRIADENRTPLSILRGKAVFVGYDLPDEDRVELPNTFGYKVPGAYGHMYAFESILNGGRIRVLSGFQRIAVAFSVLLCICLVLAIGGKFLRKFAVPIISVMWIAAVIAVSTIFLIHLPLASVLSAILTAWIGFRIAQRIQLKSRLKAAVGFDPELLESFRKQTNGGKGRMSRVTAILCADIRDYTSFVRANDIDAVTAVLSEYMAEMDSVIVQYGGYVNKFVGDEIVAVFGFPLDESDMSTRAVKASLAMLSGLSKLIQKWDRTGVPHVNAIGIGLDVGEAAFLEIGGGTKKQFDIIGNPINGAARLQALTKKVKVPFVVSRELIEGLRSEQCSADLVERFELVGTVPIRGQGERMIYGYQTGGDGSG